MNTGPLGAVVFTQLAVTEQAVGNLLNMDSTASMGHSGPGSFAVGIRLGPEQSPNRIWASEPLLACETSALKWLSGKEGFYNKR